MPELLLRVYYGVCIALVVGFLFRFTFVVASMAMSVFKRPNITTQKPTSGQ